MMTTQFVAVYGIEYCKGVLAGETPLYMNLDYKKLQEYVDAWELIEGIGFDLCGAKRFCDFAGDMKCLNYQGKIISVDDIRKAITLVEEVESLKEVG